MPTYRPTTPCATAKNVVVIIGLLIANVTGVQAARYQEQNGLIVVEIESSPPNGWSVDKTHGGFTGQSYFHWTGPDYMSDGQAGTAGLLTYDLHISTAGTYELAIHNRHDHPDHTLENDAWTRMDNGPWHKTFSSVKDVWNWQTKFELHGKYPIAIYDLAAGDHTFQIAARSKGFKIDRFHLFMASVSNATDTSHPQSSTVKPTPTMKILEPNSGETMQAGSVVMLRGDGVGVLSWSYDANSDGQGAIQIGEGTNVSFTVPTGIKAPRILTLILKDQNGQLKQDHPIGLPSDGGVTDGGVPADSGPAPDSAPTADSMPNLSPVADADVPLDVQPDSGNSQSGHVSEGGCSLTVAPDVGMLSLLLLLAAWRRFGKQG